MIYNADDAALVGCISNCVIGSINTDFSDIVKRGFDPGYRPRRRWR